MANLILTCTSCQSRYEVELDDLLPSGRKVQCSNCAHVWLEPAPGSEQPASPDNDTVDIAASDLARDRQTPNDDSTGHSYADISMTQDGYLEDDFSADDTVDVYAENGDAEIDDIEDDPLFETLDDVELGSATPRYGGDSDPAIGATQEANSSRSVPTARADGERRSRLPRLRDRTGISTLFVVALVIILAANAAWFGREKITAAVPSLAHVYAVVGIDARPGAGLAIEIDPPQYANRDGTTYLLVSGRVTNSGIRSRRIPEMVGILTNADAETVRSWTFDAEVSRIDPQQTVNFISEVADPPGDTKCLNFYFAEPAENTPCKAN